MSNRIDHAAEVPNYADSADTSDGRINVWVLQEIKSSLDALVEQQRIANLIALSESGRTTVNGARAALAGLYAGAEVDGSANMRLHPSITKALGLGDSND